MLKQLIFLFVFSFCHLLFAEEDLQTGPSESEQALEALPQWLTTEKIRISLQMTLSFDGSQESSQIEREMTSFQKLVYLSPENWRALREKAYPKTNREVLQTADGSFVMKPNNEKITALKNYDHRFWTALALFPYELWQRWSFEPQNESFGGWLQSLLETNEEKSLQNSEEDSVRIRTKTEGNKKRLEILFEGQHIHEEQTKARMRAEWILEIDPELNEDDLKESLIGGGSS